MPKINKKQDIGKYIPGSNIAWTRFKLVFCSINFSIPWPKEFKIKTAGSKPRKVEQKQLLTFILNIVGKMF